MSRWVKDNVNEVTFKWRPGQGVAGGHEDGIHISVEDISVRGEEGSLGYPGDVA